MPALARDQAVEKLAGHVEQVQSTVLAEIYSELFPEQPVANELSAAGLAHHVRKRLEAEEIVDLWNVIFPADRNVWFDEEDQTIHYNEESRGYAEAS